MAESAVKGGMKLKLVDSRHSVADDALNPCVFTTISVEGYDTWLPKYYLELVLRKHFSSCGEIIRCSVARHTDSEGRKILNSVAYLRFQGGGAAEEKALKLNGTFVRGTDVGGTDVGGWTAIVNSVTYPIVNSVTYPVPPLGCSSCVLDWKTYSFRVTGFDTSLPELDVKMALCKHFSSCGDIWRIRYLSDIGVAHIFFYEEGSEGSLERALQLDGSNMGNMTLVVTPFVSRRRRR